MKEGIQKRKYISMTAILIVAISIVLFLYIRFVQVNSVNQCFSILDDCHEQVAISIVNEMQGEQDHLESASTLIGELVKDSTENKDLLLKIMNSASVGRSYSHWEICYPNGHVMKDDGTEFDLAPDYSFDERVSKGFSVSERRTAIKDGKTQIIMLSKCIFSNDKCIGILSSVIELDEFAKKIRDGLSEGRNGILLFERGTGDILIDSSNKALGNIYTYEKKQSKEDWSKVRANFDTGIKSHASYYSDLIKENVYLSYSEINYSDWELFVSFRDSYCMQAANRNRIVTFQLLAIIFVLFSIYIVVMISEESRRQRIFIQKEEQLKDALKRAEVASESKSSFLFNMSHDLRTPLNAIVGFTGLLENSLDNKNKARDYLSKIKSSNEFLLSLVNNVLEMARIESGKATLDETIVDSKVLFENFISTFDSQFAEKGITFFRAMKVEHTNIVCDPTKLKKIFLNLLSNALKFTPSGGTVMFEINETPSETSKSAVYKIIVSDTGIGMSKDYLPHLFDKFEREYSTTISGTTGTGLGMPIVKNMLELMDGTIDVESELGKGTKYIMYIPFRIANEKEIDFIKTSAKDYSLDKFVGKRILIAEDNDLNAEIAESVLREVGFIIERAVDGVECVNMISKSEDGYYDLILMDIQMPNMDGYKTTESIRHMENQSKKQIPIVAMTANAFEEDKRNAFRCGMNAHVAKPIHVPTLLETLDILIQ